MYKVNWKKIGLCIVTLFKGRVVIGGGAKMLICDYANRHKLLRQHEGY
jgi:hypothetical protein